MSERKKIWTKTIYQYGYKYIYYYKLDHIEDISEKHKPIPGEWVKCLKNKRLVLKRFDGKREIYDPEMRKTVKRAGRPVNNCKKV